MAFTGTAVVKLISERKCRITGLSLASGASGTISLHGGTGDVKLPSQFAAEAYAIPGNADVTLQDAIQYSAVPDTAVATAIPVEAVKTGTTPADFLLTLTNNHGSLASPQQDMYVEFH
jgi:hypothetical protein